MKTKIRKESTNIKIDKAVYNKFNKLLVKRPVFEEKKGELVIKKITITKGVEEAVKFFIDMDTNPIDFKRNEIPKLLNNIDSNMFKLRDNVFSFLKVQEKKIFTKFEIDEKKYDNNYDEIMKKLAFANQRQKLIGKLLLNIIEGTVEDIQLYKKIKKEYEENEEKAKNLLK